jgi:hypothetical protein
VQQVLSSGLWKKVRARAQKAKRRRAAIAYVTRDLIGFRKGDVLVVDASERAVGCGETSAPVLRTLQRRGVHLYHCRDLHAKVLLFDQVAIVGSGNMSTSSADALVEAGVMTDQVGTVSGVASFIEQLIQQLDELQPQRIAALCRIKVVRRGYRGARERRKRTMKIEPLGNRTWLVGVRELARDPVPEEQEYIARASKLLNSPEEDLDWVRWGTRGRFVRECREGDSLVQIWRSSGAKRPSAVIRAVPVLLKQRAERWTRFYLGEATGRHAEMALGAFKRLLKELGYARSVGPFTASLLDSELADAVARRWDRGSRRGR